MLASWTCHCGQANVGGAPCSSCLNAAPAGMRAAEPAPATPRSLALTAVAAATAVVLVAGVVSAFVVGNRNGGGRGGAPAAVAVEGPRRPAAAPPAAPDADAAPGRTIEASADARPGPEAPELDRLLPELMRFVQNERGLPFKGPVRVTFLPDDEFRARYTSSADEKTEEDMEELRTLQRVLEGLGLLDRGVDLEKALETLRGDAVVGFYDTEKRDLVLRGEEPTPLVKTTIVHELTHALQGQHFDIRREDLDDRDDEASQAFSGLVEGDAVRIQQLYLRSLPAKEQKRAEQEEAEIGGRIDPDIPRVLLQLVVFPYIAGPRFTEAVLAGGGQTRLDEAFVDPPTTSEHLLHPERFLRREGAVPVETPAADGSKIDEGVLGELGLLLVLNTSGEDGRPAAQGWGGDRYVAWRNGKRTCVRATVAMDTLQDDAELRKALDRLAAKRKGVKVVGKGPVTFTSCG